MPEIGDVARVWRAPPIPGGAGYESDHDREERRYGQGSGQRKGDRQVAVPKALEASASQDGPTRTPTGSSHQPSQNQIRRIINTRA